MFSIEQMQSVLTALPDPVFILTRSGRYAALYGGSDLRYYHDGSGLVGRTLHEVLDQEKADWFLGEIRHALSTRSLHVVEYSLTGGDVQGLPDTGPPQAICFEGRVQALEFQVQGEDAVLWVASNITARKELEAKLRLQSETDSLTGLPNRRKLMEVLGNHYELFNRYETPVSLLIFDIDDFKHINDGYGHLAGDQAIVTAAEVCRAELRTTDVPGRLGGDEFVVLMPHTHWQQAVPIAERLRLRIADALRALGTLGPGATISGGLSEVASGDVSIETVLRRADDALYQAKRDGRNRIVVAKPVPAQAYPR
ncbi:GGDEF domain-containing protein [Oxalobacteraceae bacterium A2-2]